jgi:molybdopterin converting factor small subunit
MLNINIKYFGMLEEAVKKNSEVITVQGSVTVDELRNVILHKYPKLKKMDFQIARNLSLSAGDETVNDNDEFALLPPFAGG